jgi:hypothetical protein
MIVDQAGEVIVDFLTLSPSLAEIPTASALLDTSNYTFQAISYGKDISGFNQHAHGYYDPELPAIVVLSYQATSVSSYHSSAIASAIPGYKLMPEYPHPLNTRLEQGSCRTLISGISGIDNGQCANHLFLSAYSGSYTTLGCFAPSDGVDYYVVESLNDPLSKVIYSGTLSGSYNEYGTMDGFGFLTFAPLNGSQGNTQAGLGNFTSGALLTLSSNFSSTGRVPVTWRLDAGDAGSLLLFGGVYHLGLWCLDVKQMLKDGHKPPFAFNHLNNIRKYRLFAKKTFNRDLLYMNDALGLPGFNTLFGLGNPSVDSDWNRYCLYRWTIRFL